jgi:colicin import membrane protein
MRDHSPDVTAVLGEADPERPRGKFYVAQEGTRPFLLVEIVSPDTRVNDVVHKFEEYYRVGVRLYVIVDQEREDGPRQVRTYRYTPQGYEAVPLDDRGRVLLEPLGIGLGLRDNQVVCWDAATDRELGSYAQLDAAREAAERLARLEAETRRRAEEQAGAEADARRVAEERARAEAEARRAAEEQTRLAQERLREVEAELRRLRGEEPT